MRACILLPFEKPSEKSGGFFCFPATLLLAIVVIYKPTRGKDPRYERRRKIRVIRVKCYNPFTNEDVYKFFEWHEWALNCSSSFEEAVLRAVNLGDDTDTNACVTGALAAILYGGVSEEWLSQLRGREIIDSVLDKAERRIASILKKALAED